MFYKIIMIMQILATGINHSTGNLLINPMDSQSFAEKLEESIPRNASEFVSISKAGERATEFRDARERVPESDKSDPRTVGWTFLISSKDPRRNDIINAVRPLAEFRAMKNVDDPVLFNNESMDTWYDWLGRNYDKDAETEPPHYVLIVGGPQQVPFDFQSFLGIAASVGRIDFDSIDDLKNYVNKIIRLEKENAPIVNPESVFFATDAGWRDPTYYSRLYMAEPLAQHINDKFGFKTEKIIGDDATKKRLVESITRSKAAVVYTASHGMAEPNKALEVQKRINGAICCQKTDELEEEENWLFTSDDIPFDNNNPFLEGSVFFQFACFGYGTPKESVYNRWLGKEPKLNAQEDFIAAIPKKLLTHPRGPIGFIGHVDLAWLHGFDDPKNPDLPGAQGDPWNFRIKPFLKALEVLLDKRRPTGRSMIEMSKRLAQMSDLFATRSTLIENNEIPRTLQFRNRMTLDFITRNDAKNYMIFGDPAARLLISK
jgi:hypothetical protein